MVKRLETSPEAVRSPGEGVDGEPKTAEGMAGYEEKTWHPSLTLEPTHRTLSTLEECENELETPSLESPSKPSFDSPVFSPLLLGQGGVVSSHEHWSPNGPHKPLSSTAAYQSTAV